MRHITLPSRCDHPSLAAALTIACPCAVVCAQDLPTPTVSVTATATVAWKYTANAADFEQLVAADGVVFALDRGGKVHAIDAATGEGRWTTEKRFAFGWDYGLALSPAADFPALLLGTDSGLFALALDTGEPLWHTELKLGANRPACTERMVFAGSSDGSLYGCDLRSGEIRWHSDCLEDRPDDPPEFDGNKARFDGRPARPGAAVTDGSLVVLTIFDQCRAIAFDAATGARRWSFATQGWTYPAAAIDARLVYVASQDRHVYAVDKELGKESWQVATKARNEGPVAPAGRFAYFGSCDGHLYAIDTGVGRVAWKFRIEPDDRGNRPIYSQPLVGDDIVFLAAMTGVLYAVDRATGALRWQLAPSPGARLNGHLVRLGDRLFVCTSQVDQKGETAVFAIDLP